MSDATVVEELAGKVALYARRVDNYALEFLLMDGTLVTFEHHQDCCEHVYIESIVGDLNDLVGEVITLAEEVTSREDTGQFESTTYTFYKFATRKGYVDVRWVGTSNGYYSERVDVSASPEPEILKKYLMHIKENQK